MDAIALGSAPESYNVFELRLEGGVSFGFGPPRAGDAGMARILRAPDCCRASELASYFDESAKAQWILSPMDAAIRRALANDTSLTRAVDIDAISNGIGFIEVSGGYQCVLVELCLPTINLRNTGISIFEDWLGIIRATKDDLNQEALLRMSFAAVQPRIFDIAALKAGKRLATTDVELIIRPRMVQWANADFDS